MAQDIVYVSKCSMFPYKECVFCCCWVEYFINVNWVKLVDSITQVLYILLDFLLVLSIVDGEILK